MTNGGHLTHEWVKMVLLQEVALGQAERSHLVGCTQCLKMLTDAALDITKVGRGEDPDVKD